MLWYCKRAVGKMYRRIFTSSNEKSSLEYTVISGVIFDMDGTLTEPVLNFEEMRRRVGISPTRDILAHVNSLPKEEKARALEIIESIEEEAHKKLTLQPGTVELLNYLASKEIKRGLLTRNSRHGVDVFLDKLHSSIDVSLYPQLASGEIFSQVVSREFTPHKPDPAPVIHICSCWNMCPQNVLVVGDGKGDMISGHKAGTLTALLVNKPKEGVSTFQPTPDTPCDITLTSLTDLLDILQKPITITKD